MRPRILLATLACLELTFVSEVQARGSGDDSDVLERAVTVAWYRGALPFALPLAIVKSETGSVMASRGVDVQWLESPRPEKLMKTVLTVKVIVLMLEPSNWGWPADAMGAYVTYRGTAFVFLPNIFRALRLDPAMRRRPNLRETVSIAKATGKVLAHELVHALFPDEPHGSRGLMSPSLGKERLLENWHTTEHE